MMSRDRNEKEHAEQSTRGGSCDMWNVVMEWTCAHREVVVADKA